MFRNGAVCIYDTLLVFVNYSFGESRNDIGVELRKAGIISVNKSEWYRWMAGMRSGPKVSRNESFSKMFRSPNKAKAATDFSLEIRVKSALNLSLLKKKGR